jgi:YHS domain-containing protein
MISALIRDLLIPFLVFLVVRSVLGGFLAEWSRPKAGTAKRRPQVAKAGGTLHKDPVCGVYVSSDSGVAKTIGGETVYFCSVECRDKYRA